MEQKPSIYVVSIAAIVAIVIMVIVSQNFSSESVGGAYKDMASKCEKYKTMRDKYDKLYNAYCVCYSNNDCLSNQYCKFENDCNGAGKCTAKPQACEKIYQPFCGCDGQTYGNKCEAAAAGVNINYEGTCTQSICGNNICEEGEADWCPLSPCTTEPCPLAPCRIGTCPQDCKECTIDNDCPKITCGVWPCPWNQCINEQCILCNDQICQPGETPENCPQDCGSINLDVFTSIAKNAECADITNKMYLIDNKMVFWHKAGNCADAGYGYILYGKTSDDVLCTYHDSIAGPRSSCVDTNSKSIFDIILQNLNKDDLGLTSHTIKQFYPTSGVGGGGGGSGGGG